MDFLFLYLIIGVSIVEGSIITLKSKLLFSLGEVSYGIYMYHMFVIFTLALFFKKHLTTLNPFVASTIFYLSSILIILLISFISKNVFENYFLSIKGKISRKPRPQTPLIEML
jgi:peptidoglycan/LPS O-acetylase OafA/YrhL